jgi:hypothetical protein
MPEPIVTTVRRINRQEDYDRAPVGRVTALNSDGTYAVLLRSGLTVNLVNASGIPIYAEYVVKLLKSTKHGRLEIVGRSAYVWKDPVIYMA